MRCKRCHRPLSAKPDAIAARGGLVDIGLICAKAAGLLVRKAKRVRLFVARDAGETDERQADWVGCGQNMRMDHARGM